MAIYLIIFTILCCGLVFKPKYQNIYILFIIIILSVVVGFRDDIGADYNTYKAWYDNIPTLMKYSVSVSEGEIGFNLLMSLFKSLGFSFQVFSVIFSFATSYLCLMCVKYFKIRSVVMFFVIYYCLYLLAHQCNTIRHGMIVPLIWIAFYYIYTQQKLKFLLMILFSTLIHYSSVAILPFYFILRFNFKLKHLILILIIALLFYFGIFSISNIISGIVPASGIIFSKLHYYNEFFYANTSINPESKISLGLLMNIVILLFSYRRLHDVENENIYNYIWILYYWGIILSLIFAEFSILYRISNIFMVAGIFILSSLYDKYRFKRFSSKLLFIMFVILYSLFGLFNNFKSGGGEDYLPYKYDVVLFSNIY